MSDKGKALASAGAAPAPAPEPRAEVFVALCRVACAGKDGRRLDIEAGDVVEACDEDMLSLLETGAIEKQK